MSVLFSVLLLAVEAWAMTESNDSECCYLYGSTPRSRSNCVREGTQVSLTYFILNPHDNFTNLTVKWFKANDVSQCESTPDSEVIPDSQGDYQFDAVVSIKNINDSCNIGPLYRDRFILNINNFTSDKNGYYWCQIFVNNSVSQPSQYAWFYATDNSSCMQNNSYFVIASPNCAQFHTIGSSTSMTFLQQTTQAITPYDSSTEMNCTTVLSWEPHSTTTLVAPTSETELAYVAGFLSLFILLLMSLVILLLVLYTCKVQRARHQKTGKPVITYTERENSAGNQPPVETLAWASNVVVLHDTDTPREEAIYSLASDASVEKSLNPIQQDHEYDAAELLNQRDSQGHSQYNTLHREYNTSTLADNDLRSNMYNTIAEKRLNKIDLHQAKHNAVANSETRFGQVAIEIQTSNKQNQIVPQSYETVYQVPSKKSKEESTDYGVNDFFDDERYSKPQCTLHSVKNCFDDTAPQSVSRRATVYDNSELSTYPLQSEEAEYTEPFVSNRSKHIETEAETTARSNEHHYHSLEPEIAGATVNSTLVTKHDKRVRHEYDSPNLTALPVRKTEENYTTAATTFSYSTETLNDLGNVNSPILYNIEDCEFDDPMYGSVPHKSLVIQQPTQTETNASLKLTSDDDEMDMILSAMNVNPELLVNFDDAPEYNDPIDLAYMNNEMSSAHREVNGSEVDFIYA